MIKAVLAFPYAKPGGLVILRTWVITTQFLSCYTVSFVYNRKVFLYLTHLVLEDSLDGRRNICSVSPIPREKMDTLKCEYESFYPFEVRSSKILYRIIWPSLHNHAVLFPEDKWPLSMRINGDLMLNGMKMSKSTGNSLTLREAMRSLVWMLRGYRKGWLVRCQSRRESESMNSLS